MGDTSKFKTDRTAPFGFKNRLNYKIIANWEIAEHKSQGTMQLAMNSGDYEQFWYFALNGNANIQKTQKLFDDLKATPYLPKKY